MQRTAKRPPNREAFPGGQADSAAFLNLVSCKLDFQYTTRGKRADYILPLGQHNYIVMLLQLYDALEEGAQEELRSKSAKESVWAQQALEELRQRFSRLVQSAHNDKDTYSLASQETWGPS